MNQITTQKYYIFLTFKTSNAEDSVLNAVNYYFLVNAATHVNIRLCFLLSVQRKKCRVWKKSERKFYTSGKINTENRKN